MIGRDGSFHSLLSIIFLRLGGTYSGPFQSSDSPIAVATTATVYPLVHSSSSFSISSFQSNDSFDGGITNENTNENTDELLSFQSTSFGDNKSFGGGNDNEIGSGASANNDSVDGWSTLVVTFLLSSRIFEPWNGSNEDGSFLDGSSINDNANASGTDSSDSSNDNGDNCNERGASDGANIVGPSSFWSFNDNDGVKSTDTAFLGGPSLDTDNNADAFELSWSKFVFQPIINALGILNSVFLDCTSTDADGCYIEGTSINTSFFDSTSIDTDDLADGPYFTICSVSFQSFNNNDNFETFWSTGPFDGGNSHGDDDDGANLLDSNNTNGVDSFDSDGDGCPFPISSSQIWIIFLRLNLLSYV